MAKKKHKTTVSQILTKELRILPLDIAREAERIITSKIRNKTLLINKQQSVSQLRDELFKLNKYVTTATEYIPKRKDITRQLASYWMKSKIPTKFATEWDSIKRCYLQIMWNNQTPNTTQAHKKLVVAMKEKKVNVFDWYRKIFKRLCIKAARDRISKGNMASYYNNLWLKGERFISRLDLYFENWHFKTIKALINEDEYLQENLWLLRRERSEPQEIATPPLRRAQNLSSDQQVIRERSNAVYVDEVLNTQSVDMYQLRRGIHTNETTQPQPTTSQVPF